MPERIIGISLSEFTQKRRAKIEKAAGGEFTLRAYKEFEMTPEDAAPCEILFGESIPKKILRAAPKLRWFHTASVGIEWYENAEDYAAKDVILTNSVGAYGHAISEYAMMLTDMVLRRIPEYMRLQHERKWEYLGLANGTVYGSVVTVLGLGDIGGKYAQKAKAFGAHVRAVRRTRGDRPEYVDEMYTVSELDLALKDADIVAMFLPKSEETEKLLSRQRIAALKKGAIVVNVGRGTTIDEQALIDALKSGHLGGAALDVVEKEPLEPDSPLWDCPNTVITPHTAGRSSVDLIIDRIVELFCENLAAYRKGLPMKNVVKLK